LLEIFHESKDFFQLKELEKLGPKLKGIVSQSVKDVLQSLVDDGLVQADKIGASNFFWSFPSQRGAILQGRLKTVHDARDALEAQLSQLATDVETEKKSKPETDERKANLDQLASAKGELAVLEKELLQYGACDPVKVEEKKRGVMLAKEAAIRWTDNYVILLSHFSRQNGVEADEIRKYLGVNEDYEDIN